MPSSHSANLTYFAATIALAATPWTWPALAALAVLLSWRVMWRYHTLPQVLVGISLGAAVAYCWHTYCNEPVGLYIVTLVNGAVGTPLLRA